MSAVWLLSPKNRKKTFLIIFNYCVTNVLHRLMIRYFRLYGILSQLLNILNCQDSTKFSNGTKFPMNMEDNSHYSKIRFFVQKSSTLGKTNKVINSSFWTQFDGRFEFEKFGSFQYYVSSISARKSNYLILLKGKKSVIKSRKFEIR